MGCFSAATIAAAESGTSGTSGPMASPHEAEPARRARPRLAQIDFDAPPSTRSIVPVT